MESPLGTSCSVGSAEPRPCLPGTYTDAIKQETCKQCEAGKFQSATGKSGCVDCTASNYCPLGAAAELPCPAGQYSSSPNLGASESCTQCPKGESHLHLAFARLTAPPLLSVAVPVCRLAQARRAPPARRIIRRVRRARIRMRSSKRRASSARPVPSRRTQARRRARRALLDVSRAALHLAALP